MTDCINVQERMVCDDGTVLVLANHFFHIPLYAWYIVEIERFEPGEIDGVLMTPPFDIHGPLDNRADADMLLQTLLISRANLDASGNNT